MALIIPYNRNNMLAPLHFLLTVLKINITLLYSFIRCDKLKILKFDFVISISLQMIFGVNEMLHIIFFYWFFMQVPCTPLLLYRMQVRRKSLCCIISFFIFGLEFSVGICIKLGAYANFFYEEIWFNVFNDVYLYLSTYIHNTHVYIYGKYALREFSCYCVFQ